MLKIVSNVSYSLTNIINCIVYFIFFATSLYFDYLSLYLYLYFYVALVIIKLIIKKKKNSHETEELYKFHFLNAIPVY